MLAGDRNAALRLINAVREKHPGKNELMYNIQKNKKNKY
jgi:hypothetical protein